MPVRQIILRPRENTSYEMFCSPAFPDYTAAIESVKGPPGPTPNRKKISFDHHAGCQRGITLSACEQAFEFVTTGQDEVFGPMTLLMRDIDEDSLAASYVLIYPKDVHFPLLREIITYEGRIDRFAGLIKLKRSSRLLGFITWMSHPYTLAKRSGELRTAGAARHLQLMHECHARTRDMIRGKGQVLVPDEEIEILGTFEHWTFVREIGVNARLGIGALGVNAFGALTWQHDGRYGYSFGRKSSIITSFPLDELCPYLNAIEGLVPGSDDSWGGNPDNIIASSMKNGSGIPPHEMPGIVEDFLARRR